MDQTVLQYLESKVCNKCKIEKPLDEFRVSKGVVQSLCNSCHKEYMKNYYKNNRDRLLAYARDKRDETYLRRRNASLVRLYGLTLEDYEVLFLYQDGKCAICKRTPEEANERHGCLHVDHCHTTEQVRSLLCSRCNRVLGMVDEDITVLREMVEYLS